jgi:hypothetical protein
MHLARTSVGWVCACGVCAGGAGADLEWVVWCVSGADHLHVRDACHLRELEALRDCPADAPLARREAAVVRVVVNGVELQSDAVQMRRRPVLDGLRVWWVPLARKVTLDAVVLAFRCSFR